MEPRDFIERMTLPVWQASAAVRWLEGRVRNRPKADEQTPEKAALTDGDCVSQEILLVALRAHFPSVSVFVEEDTPSAEFFAANRSPETVVIDPIDGTTRYLRGDGPYAILLGLEREGRVEAALVAVPQFGVLLRATRGGGAEIARVGGAFEPARVARRGPQLLVSHGLPQEVRARANAAHWKPIVAAGAAIGVSPLLEGVSGGVRIAAESKGLSRRAWIAGLVTTEAGGRVESLEGALPARYEPGVRGALVAPSAADVEKLRELVA
ncbi:MAG TPA: inositol monophosphatase family protein [Myxococcota bacterium]|nr:inositol monophosphatase family protein [Myxococcota bacterium]